MIRLTGNPVSQSQNNLYPKNGGGGYNIFSGKAQWNEEIVRKI